MNILVWATTFGADLWSFVKYLSKRSGVTVKVIMDDPETFLNQGVARLYPLDVDFVRRRAVHHFGLPSFSPDVTIMDNRVPFGRTAPKGLMVWHGFGWRGPNDEKEFWWLHRSLRRAWGDVREPNPDFLWQCFGQWDFEHRTTVSRIHAENCVVVGAASHDDLRVPIDRAVVQPYYPFDITARRTVLIAPTWHYGDPFAHWGGVPDLLDRLMRRISDRGANVIIRLHDSYRFEAAYRRRLNELPGRYPNVLVEFKDKAPDNYLDMQVADVLVTNFSSIANLFYATRRPSIHVYPVSHADDEHSWRRYTLAGVRTKTVEHARDLWKLPLEENGGLVSYSFDELLAQLDIALDDPGCCADKSTEFLDRYMLGADGRSCERMWQALQRLVERDANL
ncbi:MAG TPA: CDP-glycerol glycerophosphotransferase family protein [Rhodothermia bacterium]|nr:CDP-glycerol glycerophosphotransferase family protein [Rhodothermia bacterium]